MSRTIGNDEEKTVFAQIQSQGCGRGDREEVTPAELSKKQAVRPNMISGWKRAASRRWNGIF